MDRIEIIQLSIEESAYLDDIIFLINHTGENVCGVSNNYIDLSDRNMTDYNGNHVKINIDTIVSIYWNLYVFIVCKEEYNPGYSHINNDLEKEFVINYMNLKLLSREFLKYILPKSIESGEYKLGWKIPQNLKDGFEEFVKNIDYHYDCAIAKDIIE